MNNHRLQGTPTGGAAGFRSRYEPLVESEHGQGLPDAAVTAVVVTWEGSAPHLADCLQAVAEAVARASRPVEVLVMDNHGPPTLREDLTGLWHRWIRYNNNLGLNPARNLGVARATAEVIAFIDDDGLVAPDFFDAGLAYFDDPGVQAVRGRVVAREHPYFSSLATHYDRGPEPLDDALVTEGASMVRRQAYLDADGLSDEVVGHEGIELTCRLLSQTDDARVLYAPDMVLHHDYLTSWRAFFRKCWTFGRSEGEAPRRDPEVARFMEEYFQRRFPRPRLPLHRRVARRGLMTLRSVVTTGGLLAARASSRENDP